MALILKILFVVSEFVYLFVIEGPHKVRNRRLAPDVSCETPVHILLMLATFAGMHIVPTLYVFSPWLDFADLAPRPLVRAAAGVLGAVVLGGALLLFWRAHRDLGDAWSPTLELRGGHKLVTGGVYHVVRHPIYAACWMWGVAQSLVLQNWIAGPAALVLFLPVYLYRIRHEERMMIDAFGDEYRDYRGRTGRVIPRLWS